MPLVIPPDTANWIVTLQNTSAGASARSTVSLGTSLLTNLDQTAVDRIANIFRDTLAPRYDNTWLMGPVHVVEGFTGVDKVWDDTGTEAGTHASAGNVPPAVSLIVTKSTGFIGAAFRGRMYMPGLDESQVDESGTVTGTERNNWQTTMDNLKTALEADAAVDKLVLFHSEGTPNAGIAHDITALTVRTTVGNMRPRQRR